MTTPLITAAELAEFRAEAEALMLDAGTAKRPTGGYAFDPSANGGQGADVEATSDVLSAACKIKPPRTVSRENEVGGRTSVVIPGELHLPADPDHPEYADLAVGDIWEMTAVHALSLSQVGRRYRITSEADGTLVTACRYSVERVAT